MKLEEVLNAIPEAERADVLAELRNATSADDVAAIAKRYDVDVDAEAIFKNFAVSETQELNDEALEEVAGGVNWSAAACTSATCSTNCA